MVEPDALTEPTRVAIAIVRRETRFLVRIRPPGGPMPGVHEFAGGKSEAGETPEDTARREGYEEIGMRLNILGLRSRFVHRYAHGLIDLHYFDALPDPLDSEPSQESGFYWVNALDLPRLTFPPANESVIAELVREYGTGSSQA